MKTLCLAVIAVLAAIVSGAPATAAPPCAGNPHYTAADFSAPVTELVADGHLPVLEMLKRFGVRTIIRYYDWPEETFACKTLLPEESDGIIKAGLSIATVFQHKNEDPEVFFSETRGTKDAERSLELADANGQPYGSAIYFAVDGVDDTIDAMVSEYRATGGRPPSQARLRYLAKIYGRGLRRYLHHYQRFLAYHAQRFRMPVSHITGRLMLPYVAVYFRNVAATFRQAAAHGTYEIGAYGSGQTCRYLLAQDLIRSCWVSQSTAWPGTRDFIKTKSWSLLQKQTTVCPSWTSRRDPTSPIGFDFNIVSEAHPDFGQWSRKRDARTMARPSLCPALEGR